MGELAGLDTAAFNSCVDDRTHKDTVEDMKKEGDELGVNSTPTIFVDGEKIEWNGYESVKTAIDAALAKKGITSVRSVAPKASIAALLPSSRRAIA